MEYPGPVRARGISLILAYMGSEDRVEKSAHADTSVEWPPVVVGIDGSALAQRAAYWAAIEADARQAPLRLVHVAARDEADLEGLESVLAARQAVLDRWGRTSQDCAPRIEPLVLSGHPGARLTELSATAQLLVVGDSQPSPLAGMLLGSVVHTLVGAARCPVALIRPLHSGASAVGPVLAAVESIGGADEVIAAAFDAAATRRCSLLVADIRRRAGAVGDLDAVIARCQQRYPTVSVQRVAVAGDRHAGLERFAVTAQLLVIGRDGHWVRRTPVSPALHVALHHTHCSVLVVPADRATTPGHTPRRQAEPQPALG
ncbi:Nucleotide-binding universal stress protein, UspA family [Nocardia amikacinitolerans]|nr:Nucleotide-binding universal stress protein, UspA family [Nocardia amikacinitolerans]